jgi:hypothetical protein
MMRLTNGRSWIEIDPVGAIISDAVLTLGDRQIRPLFQNPWRDDPREMDVLTRHLGGEWPCVPFGVAGVPPGLPDDWSCDTGAAQWHQHAHGYGAHSIWSLTKHDDQTAIAEITYPQSSPIERLERRVHLSSSSEIHLELAIVARQNVELPVGLHPVVSLSDAEPGSAFIHVKGQDTAWTFPIEVEPGRSYLQPDQRGQSLSRLKAADGAIVDARRVPFPNDSEDLVLLNAPGGCVSLLRRDIGYRVDVKWDPSDLPSCLLWLSNRGRHYAPWDARVCAAGIEPVAAAFDLGLGHSRSPDTPLARNGVRNTVKLLQGEVWKTAYSISVQAISRQAKL